MTLNLAEHPVGTYPGEDRCHLMVQATFAAADAMGWAKLIWYATDPDDQERAVGKLREAHAALGAALATFDAAPQPSAGAAAVAPEADLVDCPACAGAGYILHGYRRNECDACEGVGEMPAEYADEWVRNHQDTREATDDARLHARLERDGPQPAAPGGAS